MHRTLLGAVLALVFTTGHAQSPVTPSPEGASVYIVSPANGEVVASPFKVRFGLSGMGVAPAGMEKKNTGHHHLLIDLAEPPPAGAPLPADENHRHFGGGQTEVILELPAGTHTLQLLMADHSHVPHEPSVMSERITITVR